MSKEAMKLALEALEKCRDGFEFTRQYVGREVLPAIEGWSWYDGDVAAVNAITALREALAEQPAQQEPVAWKLVPREPTHEMLKAMDECSTEGYDERLYAGHAASVYMAAVDAAPTPPAQRTWVGLNDEEKSDLWCESTGRDCVNEDTHVFADAIEAKLREKSNG